MKLDTLKNQWQSAVQAYSTTREKLESVFDSAVAAIVGKSRSRAKFAELRTTLVQWAVDAGVNELTAKSVVGGLMLANDLRIRSKRNESQDKPRRRQIAVIVEFLHKSFPDTEDSELVNLLQATLRQLRKS